MATNKPQNPPADKEPAKVTSPPPPPKAKEIEEHRKCPLCNGRLGGVGNAYSTKGMTTYYKCGSCGHTWTATSKPGQIVINYREVEINAR